MEETFFSRFPRKLRAEITGSQSALLLRKASNLQVDRRHNLYRPEI
jgi:hypothetical protein